MAATYTALVFTVCVAMISSGSRDAGLGAVESPTVVCLTRGRSYGSHWRQLNRAFSNPLNVINRNTSFAFRPEFTLRHKIVELSLFSPPQVIQS